MIHSVTVKSFNPQVEEEVTVSISGVEVTSYMPYGISFEPVEDKLYPVSIRFIVLDDLDMQEAQGTNIGFHRIENSFAYHVVGMFDYSKKTIDIGVEFELDEEVIDDLAWFDGKTVQILVDRIHIEFLDS
ncbi:hypothetical protein JJB07_21550 [Tumebacillus sp. ITR2]|uniref:Uncharacterized protein n=1 Tax=Tumebacillus amylolyticus TaxID=2801339 RepID=A0ABS1JFX1_9BACL|nr:hypothetical protein [Tumebacillus amylolyticus]MBL0389182.1 hypothetical protein [Tumebacillus amylolyticus]